MHKFSEVLRHYRNNHLTADFETFYKFPVLTTCLESFDKQAAEFYTRNIFKLVKDEIEAAGALNVTEFPNSGDIDEYNMSKYFNQQWQFKVCYNKDNDLFACEYRLFETRELPCSYIFGVLKHRNEKCVPTSLILKRWTRDAKSDFICSIGEQDTADDIVPTLRCGAMASICWKLCDISSKNSADYRKISGELLKLISKVQNKGDAQARLSPTSALIGDPAVVKLKGAPRKVPKGQKRRRCSHYKSSRHFVRTCPLLAKEDSPAEYSNVEDETMGCRSKKSVSKLTETPKIRANSKKSRQKTEEITLTQETLKDKTNTSGIEVTKVPDAATTKIPGLPQYPMHHYPVVLPYQPYGGVLPIPFILFQMTWRTSTNILLLPELHHILSFLMSRRILVDPLSLRLQVLSLCCTGSKAINDPKVLLQKSLDAPDPQVVEDAWNTLVQMRALEKIPMGRYEPTFYGQLIASCPLSFDASVLVLKFGNAGMIRERSLVGIMMDTQPIPILHPFGEDILVMPEWINITISNCTDSMLQFL
ncbi:hypothetical protein S245_012674 [Arachis hypogaea]